jgi:hypothetical protein
VNIPTFESVGDFEIMFFHGRGPPRVKY